MFKKPDEAALSRSEIKELCNYLCKGMELADLYPGETTEIIKILDTNGDGQIQFSEFVENIDLVNEFLMVANAPENDGKDKSKPSPEKEQVQNTCGNTKTINQKMAPKRGNTMGILKIAKEQCKNNVKDPKINTTEFQTQAILIKNKEIQIVDKDEKAANVPNQLNSPKYQKNCNMVNLPPRKTKTAKPSMQQNNSLDKFEYDQDDALRPFMKTIIKKKPTKKNKRASILDMWIDKRTVYWLCLVNEPLSGVLLRAVLFPTTIMLSLRANSILVTQPIGRSSE